VDEAPAEAEGQPQIEAGGNVSEDEVYILPSP
jgi:hypothetical protein